MKNVIFGILCVMLCLCLCSCGVCENCEGTQKEQCKTCTNGEVICTEENCKYGKILFCNICSTNNPDVAFDSCYSCAGSGEIAVSCDTCAGKGYITNPFTWEKFECAKCDGSAKNTVSCEKCYGVGYSCTGKKNSTCTQYH